MGIFRSAQPPRGRLGTQTGASFDQLCSMRERIPALLCEHRKRIPNLRGIGIGRKYVGGRATEQFALVFFVRRKLYPRLVPKGQFVPKEIHCDCRGDNVVALTDVEPLRRGLNLLEYLQKTLQLLVLSHRCENCQLMTKLSGGTCISAKHGATGTLGGIVTDPNTKPHRRFILSCAHVLTSVNDEVTQPSVTQPFNRTVATVYKTLPLSSTAVNTADAALALIDDKILHHKEILGLGVPSDAGLAAVNDKVFKSGGKTCVTNGFVRCLSATCKVGSRLFSNLIVIEHMGARNQDSGALILDEKNKILGILIGGNDCYKFATDIDTVKLKLGIGDNWIWA